MKLFSEQQVHQVANAKYLLHDEDLPVAKEIWDEQVYRFIPQPYMSILDIGAHKGVFAVYCGLMGANVLALEPDSENFRTLCLNVEANHVDDKVTVANAGVWYVGERKTLWLDQEQSGGNSIFPKSTSFESRDAYFMDFNNLMVRRYDVVKMDCEGAEFEIIINASNEALRNIGYLTMEVHTWRDRDLYDAMISRLEMFFKIEGVKESNGQYGYIYATALPSCGGAGERR